MALFVALGRFTEQGLKTIREFPAVASAVRENSPSVKLIGDLYVTQGQYDLVAVLECPSQEDALLFVAQNSTRGNVRWETMSATTIDRFGELMAASAPQPNVSLVKGKRSKPDVWKT